MLYATLSKVDPQKVSVNGGGREAQLLSMFGREDLIAGTSSDFRPNGCQAAEGMDDPLEEIAARAAATSIVIINESHEQPRHRAFTDQVARRLAPLGYRIFAAEAFSNSPTGTTVRDGTGLPYLREDDGYYLNEATFGRLGRSAKELGYRLAPYEAVSDPTATPPDDMLDRIHLREAAQADNLLAIMTAARPGEKLLVHVGYSHVEEGASTWSDGREAHWMATRLKAKSGIDPLTISQTLCRGGGGATRLDQLPADYPGKLPVDLLVDHPAAIFIRHRPSWRVDAGDVAVDIPPELLPASRWSVVEARRMDEPDEAVPIDRVAVRPGEDVALMLPPGRYRVWLSACQTPFRKPQVAAWIKASTSRRRTEAGRPQVTSWWTWA